LNDLAKIVGGNIEKLRSQRGISIAALAGVAGVTRQTMSKYIQGEQDIDTGKLFVLADYFGVSVDYFFDSVECGDIAMTFRAFSPQLSFDERTRSRVQARIKTYCDVLEISGEENVIFNPESYRLPFAKGNDLSPALKNLIEQIAFEQRARLGIEDNNPDNLFELFDLKGIRVMGFPFENDRIFGVSAVSDEYGCFIVVNDDPAISEERKIFSLVHEYAHLLFHRGEYKKNCDDLALESRRGSLKEKVADLFAGRFLVPRRLLELRLSEMGYIAKKPNLVCMMYLKKHFKVSLKAIIYALVECGKLTRAEGNRFYERLAARGYAKKEPAPISPVDKNICFRERVKRLYLSGEISVGMAAELVDIPRAEFQKIAVQWLEEDGEPVA